MLKVFWFVNVCLQDCRRLERGSGTFLFQETGSMAVEGGLTGRPKMGSGKPPVLIGKFLAYLIQSAWLAWKRLLFSIRGERHEDARLIGSWTSIVSQMVAPCLRYIYLSVIFCVHLYKQALMVGRLDSFWNPSFFKWSNYEENSAWSIEFLIFWCQ